MTTVTCENNHNFEWSGGAMPTQCAICGAPILVYDDGDSHTVVGEWHKEFSFTSDDIEASPTVRQIGDGE